MILELAARQRREIRRNSHGSGQQIGLRSRDIAEGARTTEPGIQLEIGLFILKLGCRCLNYAARWERRSIAGCWRSYRFAR
jgi:hypothetical protein